MYIIIVGCGRIGFCLATFLQDDHNVVVVDSQERALGRIGDDFNGISINGNGLDLDVLKEAGIEKADALAVTTSNDNTNIVIAQIAKKVFGVPKVVARVSDLGKAEIYRNLGIDPVNSTSIFATLLREKIAGRDFTTYVFESDKLDFLEIKYNVDSDRKRVEDFNVPGEFRVITVIREQEPLIPGDDMAVEKGDIIIGIVKVAALKKLKKAFSLK